MDDDLRTAIIEFLEENEEQNFELLAEDLEKYLNEKGYAFYDERFPTPLKL